MSIGKSKFVNKPKVTVKPIAYYKMLIHVLRFGSKTRDRRDFKEVLGILIGHLEGEGDIKNVVIEDAVPISHGGSIEVAFSPDDYVSFAAVDAQFTEKGWFSIGWYHSHPSLNIFFSSTDIINQLGWQTPLNPSAIGMVFDHTYLEKEGDLGFRTFRLDNPDKGQMSGYHEVLTIVEPPDSMEYYLKLVNLIDSVHTKDPPILEINETPELFGEFKIPDESQFKVKKPKLENETIISALKEGMVKYLKLSTEPLLEFLNSWSQEVIVNAVKGNLQIRKNLMAFKDILNQGMLNLENSFKSSLTNKLNELDVYVDDKLEIFDNEQEKIKESIGNIKIELIEFLNNLFEEQVKSTTNQILKVMEEHSNLINENSDKNSEILNKLEQLQSVYADLMEKIKNIENATRDKIRVTQSNNISILTDKLHDIKSNFSDLHKTSKKVISSLENTNETFENSKQSITNTLEKTKTENQVLKGKIKELEAQNQDLLKKIKKLEKGGN